MNGPAWMPARLRVLLYGKPEDASLTIMNPAEVGIIVTSPIHVNVMQTKGTSTIMEIQRIGGNESDLISFYSNDNHAGFDSTYNMINQSFKVIP